MLNRSTSLLIQGVVWLALFSFLLFMGAEFNPWYRALYRAILIVGLLATLTYTNVYILIPRFFNSKWIILYFLIVIGLIFSSVHLAMNFIFMDYQNLEITMFNKVSKVKNVVDGKILFQPLLLIFTISSFFISSVVALIKEITEQKRKQLEAEIEKKISELKLLSFQFSPHFLLNALNNLYSVSKLHPEKVSEHIERLSVLMTHITYEQKRDSIPLEKEISFIENYIFFQQEKVDDLYGVTKDFEQLDSSLHIEPRLLIPFVENAFKYAYHPSKIMRVDLSMSSKGSEFLFKISNDISDYERREKEDGYFGVGIDSVRKILENIYPNSHELDISNTDGKYNVSLKIQLGQ